MTARKKLKRWGEYWLIRGVEGLACLLPRRVGLAVFARLGALAGWFLTHERRRADSNMAIAFPEAPVLLREAIVRAMFKNLGRNAFDFLNLSGADAKTLGTLVERVEGHEYMQRGASTGRGVIVITGHIGCWELMPAYYASLGFRVSVVARRMKVGRLNDRLVRIRNSVGVVSIDRDSNPRRMIEVLRRGEILGVLIDQHTSVSGIHVPFFGRPALTPTAVAKLAMMTGAMILPMAIFLNGRGRHVVHILPPIESTEMASRDETIRELTRRCSLAVENMIRIDPKQWVWFHHRWRDPEGAGQSRAVQN